MDKATRKYLAHYAESEKRLAELLHGRFSRVVVVPSFAEGSGLIDTLQSLPHTTANDTLVICVLNAQPDTSPEDQAANQLTVTALKAHYPTRDLISNAPPCTAFALPSGTLLLVERWQGQWNLPAKTGVGLARKIGCDIAVALHARGRIASRWIHCTDADAILPSDYFDRLDAVPGTVAALCYPFTHTTEAALRYEIGLRYFVLGLAYAHSPYAHHTVGSTLAVSTLHYAKVRGFPKRQAAEDFYLLTKLAKVGKIQRLQGEPILLSGRASHRVPFGTGPAVARIQHEPQQPHVYHPAIFDRLREHLESLGRASKSHIAFDGFRTLKWIHALRDSAFPSLPFRQACALAPFIAATHATQSSLDVKSLCDALRLQHDHHSNLTGVSYDAA